ncbi:MAG: hypothetical protein Q9227_008555 [Pyrenula ochraceoflavens]
MPPFAKFRGHRRNGSNQGSPTLNSPESPFQPWDSTSPPNDSSIPSHHWRVPTISPDNAKENADHVSNHPWTSPDSPDKPSFSGFGRPRTESNSSANSRQNSRPTLATVPSTRTQGTHSEFREGSSSLVSDQIRGGGESRFMSRLASPHSSERPNLEDLEHSKSHSSAVPKSNKTKLNLLNPMSLLARRRSSQQGIDHKVEEDELRVSSLAVPAIPEDYDPRIRGKIVHDFSKPRPRKNFSSPAAETSIISSSRVNPKKGQASYRAGDLSRHEAGSENAVRSTEHAPMFKEHFNDDVKTLRPESSGYLQNIALASMKHPDQESLPVPAFARNLPTRLPAHEDKPLPEPPPGLPKLPKDSSKPPSQTREVSPPPQKITKVPSRSQKSPPPDQSISQSALPKHMKSTSSRFSFQLGSGASTQEKILEENYKLKEANRKAQARDSVAEEGEDDDFANYDFDEDDGLEERIPGINADADDDDSVEDIPQNSLGSFNFTPAILPTGVSPTVTDATDLISQSTPRDEQGQAIGFAYTKTSPLSPKPRVAELSKFDKTTSLNGLGITSNDRLHTPSHEKDTQPFKPDQFADDDMYFDDGFITDVQLQNSSEGFDETIFDDDSGRIRDIPAQNEARLAEVLRAQKNPDILSDSGADERLRDVPPTEQTSGLTEGNLEAFHNALAFAASEAANAERFNQRNSASEASGNSVEQEARSNMRDSGPGLTSDESHFSPNATRLNVEDLDDDYDLNDNLDDDAIIAEANAEVLENDDDGFYGQEFGFYARAHSKGSSEMVNGGYFGPRGIETVHRSHSAKANFQEPSLTPITERSEWSHRNSLASLHALGVPQSAQSLPSPALANLLEMGSLDEDMSFEALMRLRRGAWGGSQTSLHSATSQNSSPVTAQMASQMLPTSGLVDAGSAMATSVYSLTGSAGIPESDEEDGDATLATKTLTQNTPRKTKADTVQSPEQFPSVSSPAWQPNEGFVKGHSRQSSGAESVSYSRDPDGSGRWMLERRRTGEDGEMEVIGREYLSGGI